MTQHFNMELREFDKHNVEPNWDKEIEKKFCWLSLKLQNYFVNNYCWFDLIICLVLIYYIR